jgi:thiamine biosynthesis protein ThiI
MMFRGCKVILVHFHSYPFTSKESYYNASALAQKLTCYQNSTNLYLAPLAKLQEAIIMAAPAKYRLLLYRRMMFRLAERIAWKEKAKAIITGESLGQVASQTLENIAATANVVSLPILRPLIGRDKESIIAEARIIDTYQTSIEPYEDCCSYLVPDNPATRANAEDLQEVEALIENMEQLLHDALNNVEMERFKFPEPEEVV